MTDYDEGWLRIGEVTAMLGWDDQRVRAWAKPTREPHLVAHEVAPPPARDRWRFEEASVHRLAAARPDLLGPTATLRTDLAPAEARGSVTHLARAVGERDRLLTEVASLREQLAARDGRPPESPVTDNASESAGSSAFDALVRGATNEPLLGPTQRLLVEALTDRLRHGPPLSDADVQTRTWLTRVVGLPES